MSTKIHVSRTVLGVTEDKGAFTFLSGDYFNIYDGVVSDASFGGDERMRRFFSFQFIRENDIAHIKILYPNTQDIVILQMGVPVTINFREYGTYILSII